jgi:arylsulfatase A-like enzyme
VFLTEALTGEVLPAMREAHANGQPFYLNFCPYAVHAPIMANERLLEPYEKLDPREAAYATMIESCDNALGAVLDELDALGIAEETLVVFSSDNGGLSAHARGGQKHTHNAPLKSGKGSAYEGGTRVPTVIRWPGVALGNTRESAPIVTQDFFTTFVHAAQAQLPAAYEEQLDGRDLRPLLSGDPVNFPARVIGWNQPHQWGAAGPGIEPFTSIRAGDWKLIYFHAGQRFELYDLAKDIGEANDLADARPLLLRDLAGVMQGWIEQTGAQLSIDRATEREVSGPLAAARKRPLVGSTPTPPR